MISKSNHASISKTRIGEKDDNISRNCWKYDSSLAMVCVEIDSISMFNFYVELAKRNEIKLMVCDLKQRVNCKCKH